MPANIRGSRPCCVTEMSHTNVLVLPVVYWSALAVSAWILGLHGGIASAATVLPGPSKNWMGEGTAIARCSRSVVVPAVDVLVQIDAGKRIVRDLGENEAKRPSQKPQVHCLQFRNGNNPIPALPSRVYLWADLSTAPWRMDAVAPEFIQRALHERPGYWKGQPARLPMLEPGCHAKLLAADGKLVGFISKRTSSDASRWQLLIEIGGRWVEMWYVGRNTFAGENRQGVLTLRHSVEFDPALQPWETRKIVNVTYRGAVDTVIPGVGPDNAFGIGLVDKKEIALIFEDACWPRYSASRDRSFLSGILYWLLH